MKKNTVFGLLLMTANSVMSVSTRSSIIKLVERKAQASSIIDIATTNENLEVLVAAVGAAGLVDVLNAPGPFTLFAPTNDAFALVENLDAIIADTDALTDLLLNHVVSGSIFSSDISDGQVVQTLGGKDFTITVASDGGVLINNAPIVLADVGASNGVVHAIGEVISFPTLPTIVEIAIADDNLSTLVAAVQAAGLVDLLDAPGPYTVFAPSNEAFTLVDGLDALLKDEIVLKTLLTNHVVFNEVSFSDLTEGLLVETAGGEDLMVTYHHGMTMVNDAHIVMSDIQASNGVIHVIDAVITFPEPIVETADEIETSTPLQTIVEIAIADDSLSTLVAAVQAAGLVDLLNAPGPYTVFAPTNEAFAAVDGLDALLKDEIVLKTLLTNHVLFFEVFSSGMADGLLVETSDGKDLMVTYHHDMIMVNNAHIVVSDIQASNGVIHVIDAVITFPESEEISIVETGDEIETSSSPGSFCGSPIVLSSFLAIILLGFV